MNGDDWRELIEEPPHGVNHGRQRSHDGGWIPLGVDEQRPFEDQLTFQTSERQAPRRKTHKPEETIIHGKISAYVNGCRCDECRAAWADYYRKRRIKS